MIQAPFHSTSKQYLYAGGLLAAGAGLYFADEWIYNQVPAASASTKNSLELFVEPFGNGFYSGPILAGMFLYGILAKRPRPRDAAMAAGASFFVASLFTRGLKYALNRSRPQANLGNNFWRPFAAPFSLSFPSGHTTGAFAIASALSCYYKDKPYLSYFLFGGASVVAVSRIVKGEHWASDVFAGALVGYTVGRFFGKYLQSDTTVGWRYQGAGLAYVF